MEEEENDKTLMIEKKLLSILYFSMFCKRRRDGFHEKLVYHVNGPTVHILRDVSHRMLTPHFVSCEVDLKQKSKRSLRPSGATRGRRWLHCTSTTDEFLSALAISLVSVVSFFMRLKSVNTDMSTSEERKGTFRPTPVTPEGVEQSGVRPHSRCRSRR